MTTRALWWSIETMFGDWLKDNQLWLGGKKSVSTNYENIIIFWEIISKCWQICTEASCFIEKKKWIVRFYQSNFNQPE